MAVKVLVAGDGHVLSRLMVEALQREPGAGELEISTLDLPWPQEPAWEIAEVKEASGSEEELISALEGVEEFVTQLAPVTERVISSAEALRLIICNSEPPRPPDRRYERDDRLGAVRSDARRFRAGQHRPGRITRLRCSMRRARIWTSPGRGSGCLR